MVATKNGFFVFFLAHTKSQLYQSEVIINMQDRNAALFTEIVYRFCLTMF